MITKKYSTWYDIVSNFGKLKVYNTYKSLQKDKHISDFKIHSYILNYPRHFRMKFYEETRNDFRQQLYMMPNVEARSLLICNLLEKLDGSTLLIFQFKDKEGKIIQKYIENYFNKKIYYIDGDVKGREDILAELKSLECDFTCLGSDKTMSRGINVPSLKNAVMISSIKNEERLRQLIGRITRLSDLKGNKGRCIDIVDNLVVDYCGQTKVNHAIKHYMERLEIYKKYDLEVIEKKIDMNKYFKNNS